MISQTPYRLLIVDDDALIRALFKQVFCRSFEVEVTDNAIDALQKIKDYSPDAIITDIHMPIMSGIELTKAIRENESLSDQLIILGVTSSTEILENEAIAAGMTQVFNKCSALCDIEKYLQETLKRAS